MLNSLTIAPSEDRRLSCPEHTPLDCCIQTCQSSFYTQYVARFVISAAIGRTLIPRYFRSMFEGGVSEFYVLLKHAKESFHNTAIILDCDLATIVTHHSQPVFTKVCGSSRTA